MMKELINRNEYSYFIWDSVLNFGHTKHLYMYNSRSWFVCWNLFKRILFMSDPNNAQMFRMAINTFDLARKIPNDRWKKSCQFFSRHTCQNQFVRDARQTKKNITIDRKYVSWAIIISTSPKKYAFNLLTT